MRLRRPSTLDDDVLEQAAGITGIGWTTSLLGYVVAVTGAGNHVVAPLVMEPQSLLYLGAVLFVTTIGLDRIRRTRSNGED